MDEVKRLLEGFADEAADGLPTADIDADVARGRRALRRIKRRRRVTGVLCVAAVSAVVLAIGNQVKWWGNPGTEIAGGPADTETAQAAPSSSSPAPAEGGETMSMFGASVVELVANQQSWNRIGCTLAPKGWSAETPIPQDRVILSQPTMRTADTDTKVVLQAAPEARTLASVQVTQSAGKTFHIGRLDGRVAGQVKLPDQWLLVELPAGDKDWNPELLRRFLDSCTVN
ncbi:hypothetical protein E0H73_13785 [Kribbella pittospori]|uniref:Uncharacterized protein n=1 Tax=Kribbella pittospori TaxID=722689 RepID=A0A4R0KM42_9ACTN|nr:hypothetical protein [Kribbella pittospori]TCC61811.1 hypothetical protein E0H73_13785 [Kribbella pittospori]